MDGSDLDDVCLWIYSKNEHTPQSSYIPICRKWPRQKDHFNLLGLPYIHENMEHHTTLVMVVSVNHCSSSTTRIVPECNCCFRALSFTLTGSREHHHDVCLHD